MSQRVDDDDIEILEHLHTRVGNVVHIRKISDVAEAEPIHLHLPMMQ